MAKKTKSRNSIDGDIHVIHRGLAIYKVYASPFYRVRIWVPAQARYIVKSTKTTSKSSAIKAAEEYYGELKQSQFIEAVPKSRLFSTYADRLISLQKQMVADGNMHPGQEANDRAILMGNNGIVSYIGKRDITSIKTNDIKAYIEHFRAKRDQSYKPSTLNKKIIAFRKVLKIAYEEGIIDAIPITPMMPRQDNPRPFFKFSPLVPKERDEYKRLLAGAASLAKNNVLVRGAPITNELYDFILFMMHSFCVL